MKLHYVYLLLALVPAALLAAGGLMITAAACSSLAWIFVFGDNPWPSYVDPLIMSISTLVALALFGAVLALAYQAGHRREAAR